MQPQENKCNHRRISATTGEYGNHRRISCLHKTQLQLVQLTSKTVQYMYQVQIGYTTPTRRISVYTTRASHS